MTGDALDDGLTLGGMEDPVEEVGLHGAVDARGLERPSREEVGGVVGRDAHRRRGNRLGDADEVGVAKPEALARLVGAVDEREVPLPKLPLQPRLGLVTYGLPRPVQHPGSAGEGGAVAAEVGDDGGGVGRQALARRQHALEPHGGARGVGGLGLPLADEGQGVAVHLIGAEEGAVGREADIGLTSLAPLLGEVSRELLLGVGEFAGEVGLDLDDRAPDERIDPAANLGDALLEADVRRMGAEPIGEDAMQQDAHGLVAGLGGEPA